MTRTKFMSVSIWLSLVVAASFSNSQDKNTSNDASAKVQKLGDFQNRADPNSEPIWRGKPSEFYTKDWQLAVCNAISNKRNDELLATIESNGFDINSVGEHGMTFVYWAYLQGNLEAYKTLLKHGASPDVAVKSDLDMLPMLNRTREQSVLVHAYQSQLRRPGFFEAGIGYTKEPNQRFIGGGTFAHYCAAHGMSTTQMALLMKIIATGVDLNAKNDRGETACHVAIDHNPDGLLILILAGADPSIPFPDGRQLVDEVRKRCNPTVNPLSVHYEVVDSWLELLLSPPKFQRARP